MLPNYDEFVGLEQVRTPMGVGPLVGRSRTWGSSARCYVGGSIAVGLLLAILLDQKDAPRLIRTVYLYPRWRCRLS